MKSSSVDTNYENEQYELLRKEAMNADLCARRGHGLALFMNRGMIAWCDALNTLGPQSVTNCVETSPLLELLPIVKSDLTPILADMVLACHTG
jgi:hypothetical protein